MPDNYDKTNGDELDRDETRALHHLCTRVYDEVISDEEMAQLNRMLHDSSAARKIYFRYVAFHNLLLTKIGVSHENETELLRHHVASEAQDALPQDAVPQNKVVQEFAERPKEQLSVEGLTESIPESRRSFLRLPMIWAVAASLLILAAGSFYWAANRRSNSLVVADNDPLKQSTDAADDFGEGAVGSGGADEIASVAHLSHISSTAQWFNPNEVFSQQAAIRPGNVLTLSEGEVELIYNSGTKLLLIGPVEFVVEAAGGKLRRGGLVASVTEAGHGFTIETPNGKVVDLGTEFGVAVDDFGVSEVNVFQGKVEAFPQGGYGQDKKYELTKGRGLQWSEDEFIPLDADLRRFAISVLDLPSDGVSAEGGLSLVDQFRLASLDASKWQSLGDVRTSATGLKMVGSEDPRDTPYLISVEQFDPAEGPITVTCDFRFTGVRSADSNSFSILTRSAEQRGIAEVPWSGTLASCARCSFGSESNSSGGILQAGVKLESDRELTSISWSGFEPPVAGTAYRVVMRDDGVNVSFTVLLRDKPSTSKTVTCRSLFRGKANFVALEGSGHGTTLIEHVKISQNISDTPLLSYADFSSHLQNDHNLHEAELQLLSTLAPDDATLVLQDDFAADQLVANDWSCLGDVLVRDGAVQLGQPNAEGHIDTWKARPYLLTRKPLDPREGELTILGRITFAENFLAGYGASFSVMTRADDNRGTGPGWENTVLQRGVRANFWPAAWDSKHNLEIHEKPTSNSITLLATQGLQTNPKVHSYLFRVVDDGQSVTLTIVDPRKPEALQTISSPATSAVNQGFIGFESCWGSPVTLDDVRIYQNSIPETNSPLPAALLTN